MNKLLYWEPCDEKFTVTSLTGREYEQHITRKLKSDNPEVDKIWFTRSTSAKPGDPIAIYLNILMDDERRLDVKVTEEQMESLDIPEAIEFLQTIDNQ
jgi:hypothetical protein